MKMIDGFPRRNRVEHWTQAEKAIMDAVEAVEHVGADPRLTDAVVLLQQARDKVADYVDGVPGQGHKIRPINTGGVTPATILRIEMDRLAELEGIVVIGFPKVNNPYLSCSCSLSELALAQALCIEHLLEVKSGRTPARSS